MSIVDKINEIIDNRMDKKTYDAEYELWLAGLHEAGHILKILEAEKAGFALFDEARIYGDEGEASYFTDDSVPMATELNTEIKVAGMVAVKTFYPTIEWYAGAELDTERAIELAGQEGMKKSFRKTEREFKKRKSELLAVAMFLFAARTAYRDNVVRVLGVE